MAFAGVLARLGYLQLWRHDDLSRRVHLQSSRWVKEAPRRARIVDRHGSVLAESVRVASCYADPRFLRRPEIVADRLAPALHIPAPLLLKKIRETSAAFVWLKRFLTSEEALAVERENLAGVGLRWEYRRSYPNGDLASSVLGFVGDDGRGLSGLEYAFDEDLVDRRAPRRTFRDGRGARLMLDAPEETDAGVLRLTLDRSIQFVAERELEAGLARSRARAGLVVVQDPQTGEILALAGRPEIERGDGRSPRPEDLAVLGTQWVFEPGSTFKIVTAAAALEEGLVRPGELINGEGGTWRVAALTINDHTPERRLTFTRAMAVSSNIGFAKVGLRVGAEKLYDYIRAFGFGARAGVELAGEGAGLLRPLRQWSRTTLPVVSFGQEIGVTAVQLAGAYSTVANGGTLFEPRLCLELRSPSGTVRRWSSPAPVRRVISTATAAVLTRILQDVVENGTGRDAALPGWTVAGKTGTAQKTDPATRAYSPDKFVASFCGFAPVLRPRLTVVVIFDEPKGISGGGYNAGPVFRNVAWQGLVKLGAPADAPARYARDNNKETPGT